MITAGQLRHLVEVQTFTMAQDSNGDDVRTYETFAIVHAEIVPLRGRELFIAQQEFAEANVRIGMRYLPGVLPLMRVLHEAVYYDILNVIDVDMRHIELTLYCKSGISDEG